MYFLILLSIGFFWGVVGVASNPSSCFAAGALMVAAGFGCGILAEVGSLFLALVLYLVYLGGMLVVFAYSVALSSDLYPEAWSGVFGDRAKAAFYTIVGSFLLCVWILFVGGCCYFAVKMADSEAGFGGISSMYGKGGWSLLIVGAGLMMTLFVVLELVREMIPSILKG